VEVESWLLAAALGFAVVNGFNDGGAVLSVGLRVASFPPLLGLLVLSASVAVVPIVFGTAVAETLVSRLVPFDGDEGTRAMLVAVVVAVVVASSLAWRGLPTSLTLAVLGALAGAGLGAGLPVAWGAVGMVLLLAAAAPLVGLVVARVVIWVLVLRGSHQPVGRRAGRWHVLGFGLLCVAYGANDGQKMLAVAAVAVGAVGAAGGTGGGSVLPPVWLLAALAVLFLGGAVLGLPRVAGTMASGLTPLRPSDAAVSELAASGVVLATGAVGSPVSMTQAMAGGLVGTGTARGLGAVRWGEVARIALAWVLTLPTALVVAWGVAALAGPAGPAGR
jgi:PiT family inorganic phosphate transporter